MIQGIGQDIVEIPAFGHDITEVRAMGELVWQKSIPDYLCFTALEAGTFTLTIPAAVTATYLSYVEWSKDGRTWTHTDNTSEAVAIDVQVASGEKVYWRGSGICTTAQNVNTGRFAYFSSDCRFGASGNISSMLKGDGILDHLVNRQTSGLTNVTFANLFNGCTTLVNAADMVLPTFTSYYTYIYYSLFRGCAALVSAPALPSTELANSCYFGMFYGCTSITTSPTLPALTMATNCYYQMYYSSGITEMPLLPSTALADSCYREMFRNCASLTTLHELPATILAVNCYRGMFYASSGFSTAPDLPATTLVDTCYANMFYNCRLLNHVKCLATDISASDCLINWLGGASSTGTFIQASGVTWPRGASGIPTGWLAYDEGEQIPNDYTPCDYIYNSSTGGGGVDLGFKFRLLDYSVEAKFKQDTVSNGMVIGTKNNDSGAIWFYNYTSADSFRINACYSSGWKYNVNGFMPLDTNTHIIRYVGDADGCYQISDGTQSGIHDISTWAADESTDNLFIFGRAASTNTYKGGIYYLWVKDNSTDDVICNLIPCSRNSDGAAGFWDTAQKKFFTSTYWTAHFDNE